MTTASNVRRYLARHAPKTARGRRIAASLGFVAVSLLLSVSIFATGPRATPEVPAEKAWPVSVVTIEPADLAPTFTTFGRVESSRVARVQSDLVAPIVAVHVAEGDWVDAGAVLVELDRDAFALRVEERAADLAAARAMLASVLTERKQLETTAEHYQSVYEVAQKKLARHRDLMERRMIAQSLLDEAVQQASTATIEYRNHLRTLEDIPNRISEAKARIERAESLLAQAQLDLEHATVRAPFAGPVLSVTAAPGDHSALGTPLVEVASAEHLELRAQIPDAYVERLRHHLATGRAVSASAPELREVGLDLERLAGNVRTGRSGLDAFFVAERGPEGLRSALGRVVKVSVRLPAETGVVALPVQSIYENDRIYEVVDERLRGVTVERVGDYATDDGEYRVLVRSPELGQGLRIVTTQLPTAITGLRVQPIQPEAATEAHLAAERGS